MIDKGVLFVFCLCFGLLLFPSVSAISASLSDINSTLAKVSVSSATNLYAYEVRLYYNTGSVGSASYYGFLGSGTTTGSNKRNGYVNVYESKMDGTQTGISGSGDLFNISYSGNLALCRLKAVYADGTEDVVTYSCGDSGNNFTGGGVGGGGGGGGGAGISPEQKAKGVGFSLMEIVANVILTKADEQVLTITNNGTEPVNLTIDTDLNKTVSLPSSVVIEPGSSKEVKISITALERGLLTGQITFSIDNLKVYSLPLIINPQSEKFLFDSSIVLASRYRKVSVGERLSAQIDLLQVGKVEGRVDVVANYLIKDFAGNNYLEESETFFVDSQKSYTKSFDTQDLPPGKYVLGIELVYPGAFATSSVQFEVLEKGTFLQEGILLIGAAALIVMVTVGVVFWALHRTARISVGSGNKNAKPRR